MRASQQRVGRGLFVWMLATALALAAREATAQPAATVTGRTVDAFSMRPVAGATVRAGEVSTITGADGAFALALPRGAATIEVTAPGYLAERLAVSIGDTVLALEVLLLDDAQFTEQVDVVGGANPIAAPPSTVDVSPQEVRSVAGAAENVFRVLQTLPGVNAADDFGSRLSVRGGGPDQNLTLMDGVEIHNPYRLFGLTSAFNPETVENFELTAGGFSARHGDRLSSILLVENRAGTRERGFAGSASLSLTDSNVVLEGRLPGTLTGSWLVTGRRTYYDLVADRVTGEDLPSFGDLQGKAVWEPRPGQRVTVVGLRSRESADAAFDDSDTGSTADFVTDGRSDLVSASFFSTLGTRASSRTIASWYVFGETIDFDGDLRDEAERSNAPGDEAFGRAAVVFTRDLTVRDVSLRQELALKASPAHFLETGVEVHALDTRWRWLIEGDRNESEANGSSIQGGVGLPSDLDSQRDTLRAGAWLLDRWQATPRLLLEPGLRVDWSGVGDEVVASPRLAANLDLGAGWRTRAAVGLFTQSPGYEKLLQSDYFVDLSAGDALGLRSERAVHVLGSVEKDLGSGTTARLEGYYKSFDRLIVGRLETPAETAARVALYQFPPDLQGSVPTEPQITSTPENGATGHAYGFDLYVSRRPTSGSERFSGWASYTWGRAEIESYGRTLPFDYDRRHALSLVGSYRVWRWLELASTVRVASGFPWSPAVALRVAAESMTSEAGAVTAYVPEVDANGLYVWTTDPGGVENLNSARLPVFARVDIRATFRPSWAAGRWQFYVEVINVLARDNAGSFNPTLEYDPGSDRPRLTYDAAGGVPLLPSLGVRVRF